MPPSPRSNCSPRRGRFDGSADRHRPKERATPPNEPRHSNHRVILTSVVARKRAKHNTTRRRYPKFGCGVWLPGLRGKTHRRWPVECCAVRVERWPEHSLIAHPARPSRVSSTVSETGLVRHKRVTAEGPLIHREVLTLTGVSATRAASTTKGPRTRTRPLQIPQRGTYSGEMDEMGEMDAPAPSADS